MGSTQVEPHLMDAKDTSKDLRLKMERSYSWAKLESGYLEKAKRNRKSSGEWGMSTNNHQSLQVMTELEEVKQELRKLKLDMASLLEEKRRSEKERDVFSLKTESCSSLAEILRKEIDETNEEQVLVELARIEAIKECTAIESQRKQDSEKYSGEMEEWRTRIDRINAEVDAAKEVETNLAITLADVNVLENGLKEIKEMDKMILVKKTEENLESDSLGGEEADNLEFLDSITKEIELTKQELASAKEESFRLMASMDVARTELRNVSEEAAHAKRREDKTELAIQNLNAKLLRRRAKLEAASSAEENAKLMISNLSSTLEQYKAEAEAAKKEVSLVKEETWKIKEEIDRTDSEIEEAEEKLQTIIEELKSIKLSEAKALDNLKVLAESTRRSRALASEHSSVITISKFEYKYLKGRAAGAEEIADKKVAAAQAWIEALKASEREILMQTEKAKHEIRAQKSEERKVADESQPTEMETWLQTYDKNIVPGKKQNASQPRRSSSTSGKVTPVRRAKHRVSISSATRGTPRTVPFPAKRKTKAMADLEVL